MHQMYSLYCIHRSIVNLKEKLQKFYEFLNLGIFIKNIAFILEIYILFIIR